LRQAATLAWAFCADSYQRLRAQCVTLALERPGAAATLAAAALIVLVAGGWWLLSPGAPPAGEFREPRMQLVCESCGLREFKPLSELEGQPRGPNGLLFCPRCGKPTADLYRPGVIPAVRPPASASNEAP
jgi:hypothetical protein